VLDCCGVCLFVVLEVGCVSNRLSSLVNISTVTTLGIV
jgi:hypothetical protein